MRHWWTVSNNKLQTWFLVCYQTDTGKCTWKEQNNQSTPPTPVQLASSNAYTYTTCQVYCMYQLPCLMLENVQVLLIHTVYCVIISIRWTQIQIFMDFVDELNNDIINNALYCLVWTYFIVIWIQWDWTQVPKLI